MMRGAPNAFYPARVAEDRQGDEQFLDPSSANPRTSARAAAT